METYQPIYDAVRSKLENCDVSAAVQSAMQNMDISFYADRTATVFEESAHEMQRYSVLLKPKLFKDGNQWCALYGDNLQEGVAGFGDTPHKAMLNFDTEMNKP